MSVIPATGSAVQPDPITAVRHHEWVARGQLAREGVRAARGQGRERPAHLTIFLLMPRTDVGGGARILVEHANRLQDRGHRVVLLSHFSRPTWCEVRAEFREVPFGVDLATGIDPCDVIVAGYWEQVLACVATGLAPVLHFEQGDRHLFEEIDAVSKALVQANMDAASATVTVSATVAAVVQSRFGVRADVVPNAIDPRTFHTQDRRTGPPSMMCVGYDGNAFKGLPEIKQVWERLRTRHPDLDLVWVSPHPPRRPAGRVVVAPAQTELAELYRQASVYLCASHYESFPLPPIEAMASGTPVVATRNVGVLEYAQDGINSLLADIGDVEGMAAAVDRVLTDDALAEALREGGLLTAASYSWQDVTDRMESLLRDVAAGPRHQPGRDGWRVSLDGLSFRDPRAVERLEHRLQTTPHREVAVPVSSPAFEGHQVMRWRVVARRAQGLPGVTRVPLAADPLDVRHPPRPPAAQRAFAAGRFPDALAALVRHLAVDPGACRWAALCLLELERDAEAVELLDLALTQWPDHTDLHYLRALAHTLTGREVDRKSVHQTVECLGPATRYDEWFDSPLELLRQRLPLEDSA